MSHLGRRVRAIKSVHFIKTGTEYIILHHNDEAMDLDGSAGGGWWLPDHPCSIFEWVNMIGERGML